VRGTRTGVVLLAAVALAGCGSSGKSSSGRLTSGQRSALIQRLEDVRTAAAAGNVAATRTALDRFRSAVVHLRRTGALDDAQARAMRVGAGRVMSRVQSDHPAPVAPVTTQTAPAPAPVPPPGKSKHGKEHHKDHGHGHGKGEGGD
jgi:hypothetical protein